MFRRLFLTYLSLVLATVALVGLLIYERAEDVFYLLVRDVAAAVALIVLAGGWSGVCLGPAVHAAAGGVA